MKNPDYSGRPWAENKGLSIFTGSNCLVAIDESYTTFFSSVLAGDREICQRFLALNGKPIKEERKTSVRILSRISDDEGRVPMSFVLKIYFYPHIGRLRAIGQMPKAEREFRGLRRCQELGIPVAQPVGFGSQMGRFGTIRFCFVITRLVENAVDFRNWLMEKDKLKMRGRESKANIMGQLGRYLHTLHEERFFLMRPSPKNILLNDPNTAQPRPLFIDLAYARPLPSGLLARHAQRIDLGRLFGPLLRRDEHDLLDPFLEIYLPDPFGRTSADLKRLIIQAANTQSNRTPLSWTSNKIQRASPRRIRRALRNAVRTLTD